MSTSSWGDLRKQAEAEGPVTFEPLAAGTYQAEIESAKYVQAKTGSDMFEVKFRVTSGPNENRRIWTNLVAKKDSPGSMRFFFEKCEALGLGAGFFDQEPSNEQVAEALCGRSATITVVAGTYQGKPKTEVDRIAPASGAAAPSAPSAPAAEASTQPAESAPIKPPF